MSFVSLRLWKGFLHFFFFAAGDSESGGSFWPGMLHSIALLSAAQLIRIRKLNSLVRL